MLISERHKQIIFALQQNPGINVRQLAQQLHFSEPTIRRDLTELDKKGIITKHYGGAVLNEGAADREIPFVLRQHERSQAKARLGYLATQYIRDGMVIMLDGSTSAYHLVPYLSKYKDIIVITSGAKTAVALAELKIPVFCTGGRMRTNSFSYIGQEAEDTVRRYNADVMFFSCHGLSPEGMMTDPSIEEANLRQVMFSKSRQRYLLCDSSKFDTTCFYDMGSIAELDGVICDSPLPDHLQALLKK